MRLRSERHPRRESRTDTGNRRRPAATRFDLSSIAFTEDEILADLLYPARLPIRAPRGR